MIAVKTSRHFLASLRALLALTVILGIVYPLAMTGVARALPAQADGSIVTRNGHEVGSSLLGQKADGPQWFQARPSVSDQAGDTSGGSNLGQNSADQLKAVAERRAVLTKANPSARGSIPNDALTASSSGLDPDISLAFAHWQATRVSQARHLSVERIDKLIDAHVTEPTLGYLGQRRVNVLELNLALAELSS